MDGTERRQTQPDEGRSRSLEYVSERRWPSHRSSRGGSRPSRVVMVVMTLLDQAKNSARGP